MNKNRKRDLPVKLRRASNPDVGIWVRGERSEKNWEETKHRERAKIWIGSSLKRETEVRYEHVVCPLWPREEGKGRAGKSCGCRMQGLGLCGKGRAKLG